jgi:hypothetical protein
MFWLRNDLFFFLVGGAGRVRRMGDLGMWILSCFVYFSLCGGRRCAVLKKKKPGFCCRLGLFFLLFG